MLIKVVAKYLVSGIEARNIFCYSLEGEELTPELAVGVSNGLIQRFYVPLRPCLAAGSFHLYEVEVQKQLQGREFLRFWTVPADIRGESGVDPLPPYSAILIIGRTMAKRIRGLKFVSGLHEHVANGGVINPHWYPALNSAVVGYQSIIDVGDVQFIPVILSRGGTGHNIYTASYRKHLFSLRRRNYE